MQADTKATQSSPRPGPMHWMESAAFVVSNAIPPVLSAPQSPQIFPWREDSICVHLRWLTFRSVAAPPRCIHLRFRVRSDR